MKEISLIIGSGFSVPDGMKTVGQINDILAKLDEKDIYIHSDMTLILLNGQEKPTFSSHRGDELFFVHFIKWHIKNVGGDFNYERFYDFVTSYLRFENHKAELEPFFQDFERDILKTTSPSGNLYNCISKFSDYFNKLISSLLQSRKYYEDVGLGNYPPYDGFSTFLKELVEDDFIIHNHSLNHDLLFEHLASKHSDLWQHFTDGYSDLGSPYYGNVHLQQSISKNYKVRLKRFTNEYEKPIRLYKLHGSVDTYIANVAHLNVDQTRVKRDWGVGEIQKEVVDEEKKHKYTSLFQNTHPDMLSGASSKALWYKQPYYKELQEYFKENLEKSELLLVIGYGFNDDGINHIIENQFLISGKPMRVIDIVKPNTRFIEDYNTTLIQKSIDKVTYEEWMEIKKEAVKNMH